MRDVRVGLVPTRPMMLSGDGDFAAMWTNMPFEVQERMVEFPREKSLLCLSAGMGLSKTRCTMRARRS